MFEEHTIDVHRERLRRKAQSLGVAFREREFDRIAMERGFYETMGMTDDI